MSVSTPVFTSVDEIETQPYFLIDRTNLDHESAPGEGQPVINNLRIRVLNDHLEIYYREGGWPASFPPGPQVKSGSGGQLSPELLEAHRQRGDQKARSQVWRLVVSHGLNHMLTLTFAEELTDYSAGWDAFRDWKRRAFRKRGTFLYVAVAAVHEQRTGVDGAPCWHLHVAVDQHWNEDELADLWALGSVDHSRFDAPENLAGYLQHNITISAVHRPVGKRYRAAQGMAGTIKRNTVDCPAAEAQLAELLEQLLALGGELTDCRHLAEWQGTVLRLKFSETVALDQVALPDWSSG